MLDFGPSNQSKVINIIDRKGYEIVIRAMLMWSPSLFSLKSSLVVDVGLCEWLYVPSTLKNRHM